MGTTFYDLLQQMSLFLEYPKLQVPLGGPDHVNIQEIEYIVCADSNPVIILRGRDVCIVYQYFRCE